MSKSARMSIFTLIFALTGCVISVGFDERELGVWMSSAGVFLAIVNNSLAIKFPQWKEVRKDD